MQQRKKMEMKGVRKVLGLLGLESVAADWVGAEERSRM